MNNHMIDIHKCGGISREWYIFVVDGKTSVIYASNFCLPNKPIMNDTNQPKLSPDTYIGSISENQLKMLQALKPDLTVGDILDVIHGDNKR